jgi:xylitol oxidase
VRFSAARRHAPSSIDELRRIVAASNSCRVVGSAHSFNTIADTNGDLVALVGLPRRIEIAADRASVTVSAGLRYGELTPVLDAAGLALHNLGSLPHISIAGACSTGTHGSGDSNRCLAGAVLKVELVTATGDLIAIQHGDPDFTGAVVSLGTLGVVTALTLQVEPAYEASQRVWLGLPFEAFVEHIDHVFAAGYSVSPFTTWQADVIEQVWVKRRHDRQPDTATSDQLLADLGARPADRLIHPVAGIAADSCTEQLGRPGRWHARLPHFRLEFTPSAGDELQTEFFVDRRHARAAVSAVRAVADQLAPALLISELRSVAADDLWLSMCHGRDTLALHFTWRPDPAAATDAIVAVERALAPFDARPHWGKLFTLSPDTIATRYPRFHDARRLAERYDPAGCFRNGFTSHVFGW